MEMRQEAPPLVTTLSSMMSAKSVSCQAEVLDKKEKKRGREPILIPIFKLGTNC